MKDRVRGEKIMHSRIEGCCMIDEMMEKLLEGRESAAHMDLYSPLAHQAGENNCLSTRPLVFAAGGGLTCLCLKVQTFVYVKILLG